MLDELQGLGPVGHMLLAALALAALYGAAVGLQLAAHALVAWRNQRHLAQVCLLQARLHGLQQRQRFALRLQRETSPSATRKEPNHV